MKNALQINPSQMFNAPLLFFVIPSVQIGVGIHGFQSIIYEDAKQDSWISIIISFLAAHLVVLVMFKTLEMYDSNDFYGISLDLFGKYFGNFINMFLIVYWSMAFFSIIINYREVIITWVFPNLSPSFITVTLLIIVIYAFTGGLRVMLGISVFSFLGLWIPVILLYPLEYSNFNYLLPVLDNDLISLLKGAYSMTFTIVGFEILNVLYPFVKEKNKAPKYVHLGLLFTLSIYLFIMLISLTFFSGEQLMKTIWATLTLFSIIRLPFLERIELITICFWMLIILPNLCLFAWSAYRGFIRIIKINEKKFFLIFACLIFIGSLFVQSRNDINTVNNIFGNYAFYVVFVYPIFLYFSASIKKKFSKQRVKKS